MEISQAILKSDVFSGISEVDIINILASHHYQIKKFAENDIIVSQNDKCKWFQLVVSGSVRGEMSNIDGKILKIEDVEEGGTIALPFLFGNNNRLPVSVFANTETEILRISKNELLKILNENNIILENILVLISERSQFLTSKLRFLSMKTIKEKFAFYILQQLEKDKKEVILSKNQKTLAEMFGVTRPALARAIKMLIKDGLIDVKGKHVKVKNISGLRDCGDA